MLRSAIACRFFTLVFGPSWAGATLINLSSTVDVASANRGLGTGSAGTGSATLTFEVTNPLTWSGSLREQEPVFVDAFAAADVEVARRAKSHRPAWTPR